MARVIRSDVSFSSSCDRSAKKFFADLVLVERSCLGCRELCAIGADLLRE